MHLMKPFSPNETGIEVRGAITRIETELQLQFSLSDPKKLTLDSLHHGSFPRWDRADELWKTTCFEAFFGIPGESAYWEFNLSPSKIKWNLYFFDSYRSPQPPRRSHDFELTNVKMSDTTLDCTLTTDVHLNQIEASLCAVIRTTKGSFYHAFKHAADKPDFHDRRSFLREIRD